MCKIYVITLAYSDAGVHTSVAKTMLDATLKSCAKYNWPVDVFHAVNGYNLDADKWSKCQLKEPRAKTHRGKKFSDKPGAQGCFLSHFSLWQICANSKSSIIVLEDDVNVIAPLPQINTEFDLLKLHAPREHKEHPLVGEWSPGAFGYWLSPRGAGKLINFVINNGPKYTDKCIGSKILDWRYIETPIIELIKRHGSSTNPTKYPYIGF